MRIKAIVALVCPVCGSDLSGLDTDTVFGCAYCGVGYQPGPDGLLGPYPFATASKPNRSAPQASYNGVVPDFWILGFT